MTIRAINDSNELFYQIQKAYMFFLLIELIIARIFYRFGMIFLPFGVYKAIYYVGVIARYVLVFLNFILLGFIIFRGAVMLFQNFSFLRLIPVIGLSFVFSFFLSSYVFYFLNLPFSVIYEVSGLVVIGFSINYLITYNIYSKIILRKEFAEYKIILLTVLLIFFTILIITFNFALIHQIFYRLNSIFEIPYRFHGFLFGISQLMSIFLIAPLFFTLHFLFRERIEKKGLLEKIKDKPLNFLKKIIPIIIICFMVILILGFINSPIVMGETGSMTPPIIFGLLIVFVSGYYDIQSSLPLINWSIIALGLFGLGCYFLWVVGKSKKNQTMKQFSYGMFVIFCTAFKFVEGSDLFFLMVLLNGFLMLTWRESEF